MIQSIWEESFFLKDNLVHTTIKATAYEIKGMRQTRNQTGS